MRHSTMPHTLLIAFAMSLGLLCSGLEAGITSIGSVTPSYDSSQPWAISGDLVVGAVGDGTLSVLAGSDVAATGNGTLGSLADTTGTITVNGDGSTLALGEALTVGAWGVGTFTVSGGGSLTSGEGQIGGYNSLAGHPLADYFAPGVELPDGTGTVTVTGTGSSWQSDSVIVGLFGDGTMAVSAGGHVTDYGAMVGVGNNGVGEVEVSGTDSLWATDGNLVVAGWGQGSVTVEDGGNVTAKTTYIGGMPFEVLNETFDANLIPDGTGTVTVSGSGSSLTTTNDLFVGYSASGALDVNEGGQVTSNGGILGGGPDAIGTVLVHGTGSTWDVGDTLDVGAWGTGTLTIFDGGQVTADTLKIGGFEVNEADFDPAMLAAFGTEAQGTGTVTVTGTGSSLTVTGDDTLVVGGWGTGTLTVSAGGTVTAMDTVIGGYDPDYATLQEYFAPGAELGGGTGTVTVTGTGSTLNAAELTVGFSGDGALGINSGGTVAADNTWAGVMPDVTGTVSVSGTGSSWTNTEEIVLGVWGQGIATIQDGAQASAGSAYLGGVPFELMHAEYDPDLLPDGTGTLTVTGAGSTLDVLDDLYVGYFGNGTLDVNEGGQVISGMGVLGGAPEAVGTVTVDGSGSSWTLDNGLAVGAWGSGTLTISGGGQVTAEDVTIGGAEVNEADLDADMLVDFGDIAGTGAVTVTGAGSRLDVTSPDSLYVGYTGTGTLNVTAGGAVASEGAGIGVMPDSTGTATVTGAGSTWENTGNMFVGGYGTGTLTVASGGEADIGNLLFIGGFDPEALDIDTEAVGYDPNGTGTVTVTGSGSILEAKGIGVGISGEAMLSILNGGEVQAEAVAVGIDSNGVGQVTVDGEGSTLAIAAESAMDLPSLDGEGHLTVSNGGEVTVDGAGRLAVADDITLGSEGEGTMTISDGGMVMSDRGVIGGTDPQYSDLADYFDEEADFGDGAGTVTVTGAGSTWQADTIMVGFSGVGNLNITDGGLVTDYMGMVGVVSDANGTVLVSGEDSTWTNGALVVGAWGNGDLTIEDGAEVTAGDAYVGGMPFGLIDAEYDADHIPTGTGAVTVTGEGSVLRTTVWDSLYVGYYGDGTLDADEGGRVESQVAGIGVMPGSTGAVTVDGAATPEEGEPTPSTWANSASVFVGGYGTGSLTVSNGGVVDIDNSLYVGGFDSELFGIDTEAIGHDPDGTGTVLVTGEGSTLYGTGLDLLYVGYSGTGTLNVENGGYVESGSAIIAEMEGSTGSVTVSGEGSLWENTNTLIVGESGTATLTIEEGGRVETADASIGQLVGSSGTAMVTGEGSQWVIDGDLYVGGHEEGDGGTGVLNVSDGGQVWVGDELYVWEDGVLTGDGTLDVASDWTVHNYGTIAPGNSGIGTLTVNGHVVFEELSVLEVEIANDGTSDLLAVNGNVDIAGGTVRVMSEGTIVGTHTYEIIEADSVDGEFETLDTALIWSVVDANLAYDPGEVWLNVTAVAFDDANIWQTRNQRAVAQALQEIAQSEGGNDVTEGLQQLGDVNDVRHSYDQLCGYIRPTLAPITTMGTNRFMGTVSDRLSGTLAARSSRFNRASSLSTDGRTFDTHPYGQVFAIGNGSSVLGDSKWGVWGKGYGLFGDRESETGFSGYQYRTYGFGLGGDYQMTESMLAGVTVGFSNSGADYSGSADESSADAVHFGVYGRYTWGNAYVDGLLTYSHMSYTTDRYVDLGSEHLEGDFSGTDLGGYIEAGFRWKELEGWRVNPLASLQVSCLTVNGYTETGGASVLAFDSQNYTSTRGSLGARITRDLHNNSGTMRALCEIRGRWVHEFGDVQSDVDASFASDPGVVFNVSDAEVDRDSAVLGTGLSSRLNDHARVSVDYDVRLNADETAHVVSFVGEYRW